MACARSALRGWLEDALEFAIVVRSSACSRHASAYRIPHNTLPIAALIRRLPYPQLAIRPNRHMTNDQRQFSGEAARKLGAPPKS
ncbi:MAG: hypothetical protein NXH88_16055 [Hyphomonas sp.]|nr:hypothetical protein [Hyphomonas sp.]